MVLRCLKPQCLCCVRWHLLLQAARRSACTASAQTPAWSLVGGGSACLLTPVRLLQVMEVDVDMLTCQVTEGLTEDAVSARLHQGGLVPPLYLHSSIHTRQDSRLSESTVEAEWEQRVSQLFRSQVCFCTALLLLFHIFAQLT